MSALFSEDPLHDESCPCHADEFAGPTLRQIEDDLTVALFSRYGSVAAGKYRARSRWEADARYILVFLESLRHQRRTRLPSKRESSS